MPCVKKREWLRQVRVFLFDNASLISEDMSILFHCVSVPWFERRAFRDILSASPQTIKEKFENNTVEIIPLNFNSGRFLFISLSETSRHSLIHTTAEVKYHNILKMLVKPVLWLLKVNCMLGTTFFNNHHEGHVTRSVFSVKR